MSSSKLTAENAYIFRIVHIDNISWLLDNGIHSSSSKTKSPAYRSIGNPDIIDKRRKRDVPVEPFGTLADYVPFYFTPYSPMLYNIETGYGEINKISPQNIIILVSSLHNIENLELSFLFTDIHAYLAHANFYQSTTQLNEVIDWEMLQKRDFQRDPEHPQKSERYQAEALIYKHVPIDALRGIICYNETAKNILKKECDDRSLEITIHPTTAWYFT